jgi:hypothetical protein
MPAQKVLNFRGLLQFHLRLQADASRGGFGDEKITGCTVQAV